MVNEFWSYVVSEIEADKIKKIDIHGVVGVICPMYFIKSAMSNPKFGNGKMMDESIARYGRGKVQDNFREKKHHDYRK